MFSFQLAGRSNHGRVHRRPRLHIHRSVNGIHGRVTAGERAPATDRPRSYAVGCSSVFGNSEFLLTDRSPSRRLSSTTTSAATFAGASPNRAQSPAKTSCVLIGTIADAHNRELRIEFGCGGVDVELTDKTSIRPGTYMLVTSDLKLFDMNL